MLSHWGNSTEFYTKLRCIGTWPSLAFIYERKTTFLEFLFSSMSYKSFPEGVCSYRKELLKEEQNSFSFRSWPPLKGEIKMKMGELFFLKGIHSP